MRVPVSWLKDYVDISMPVEQLAERLTFAGLEVEKVEYIGVPGAELVWDREKIVTGEVVAVERHPNADRLLLVDVNIGRPDVLRLVTGAPNLAVGDHGLKVAVALNGARLYDGHKEGRVLTVLKPATLRGIRNDSMVCSEKELGLSDEHEGIILLPEGTPVGVPLQDYLGDVVLEIAILPNTARCASIIGVAREVAALTGQKVRYPTIEYTESAVAVADVVTVRIEDPRLNPRFTASVITGLTQRPSPFWMQQRLKRAGIRAINNIVDVSNYVMLEWGQPTHTFDLGALRRLGGQSHVTIVTRTARPGETLVTLDGKPHELLPPDILVCDETQPLSVAGVMGGATSEVSDRTTDVLFEVASWDPVSIRRTAREHDFHSEASFRFTRGVHPDIAMVANRRGLQLMQQLGGGAIARGIVDVYPAPPAPVVVELDPRYVDQLLGVNINITDMQRALEALEFTVAPVMAGDAPRLRVTAPNHRLDIEGPHDLVEEIGRVYGLQNIPTTLFDEEMPAAIGNPPLEFEERVKDVLVEAGLSEIVSYRMTTPEQEARIYAPGTAPDDRPYVLIQNPINVERSAMRHTLIAGALESLQANTRHHDRVAVFEVGSVYLPGEKDAAEVAFAGDEKLPDEQTRLVLAMTGAQSTRTWRGGVGAPMDFFDLKGVVETLLDAVHVAGEVAYVAATHPSLYPGRAAAIEINGRQIGSFGELHPLVRAAWQLPDQPVLVADINLVALRAAAQDLAQIREVPRFPAVIEDLAVAVAEDVPAATVEQVIRRAGGALLRDVRLFDVYRGDQLGAGRKSLAYSLTYQAPDRTLSDAEIEKPRSKIIKALESQVGGSIRAG